MENMVVLVDKHMEAQMKTRNQKHLVGVSHPRPAVLAGGCISFADIFLAIFDLIDHYTKLF